jgi:hypothetical protein
MEGLAKNLREMDPAKLPQQFQDFNFQDMETEFAGLKTKADQFLDAPKMDKVKEMNFDDVKADFNNLKGVKDSLMNFPSSGNMNDLAAAVNFTDLKQKFEKLSGVSKNLKDI